MTLTERRRSPAHPGPGRKDERPGELLRARVYLASLSFGAPILAVVWGLNALASPPDPFIAYAYPPMFLMCVWAAWWLLARRPVVTAELVVFAANVVFLLGQLLAILLLQPQHVVDQSSSAYWSFTALAAIGFLILDSRRGLRVMAALYALAVLLPWAALSLTGTTATRGPQLLRVQLTCGAILALLYALAWYRERFAHEQTQRLTFEYLAHTDALTGIHNRRSVYQVIDHELASGGEAPLSVVLFDLDHFKKLNDTYGHAAGDAALVETARRATEAVRPADTLGRWGGEEFMIVLPGVDLPVALLIAERVRAALAGSAMPDAGRVTASFGVASRRPGDTRDRLVSRADAGLYRAKAGGRNQVAFADGLEFYQAGPSLDHQPAVATDAVQNGTGTGERSA